jgi:hypothetical protein
MSTTPEDTNQVFERLSEDFQDPVIGSRLPVSHQISDGTPSEESLQVYRSDSAEFHSDLQSQVIARNSIAVPGPIRGCRMELLLWSDEEDPACRATMCTCVVGADPIQTCPNPVSFELSIHMEYLDDIQDVSSRSDPTP